MTATLLIGDVHERQAELIARGEKFDLIITSPPFYNLRSYLPDDHPQKHLEIGSEQTPADWLDTMLAITGEWRRLLTRHGSIAVEIGDTYADSGGAGGDYDKGGLREGQPRFRQRRSSPLGSAGPRFTVDGKGGFGWPLDKSLCGIPTLYTWSLAYGRNLLTGTPSPAGQWRIRNLKPWIRTNPPVGALGDKERPATSYITVATLARDRWFDLDAVRTAAINGHQDPATRGSGGRGRLGTDGEMGEMVAGCNPGGAPPLDWWHQIDALIDDELQQRAGQSAGGSGRNGGGRLSHAKRDLDDNRIEQGGSSVGARGWHIRRRLEAAGHLTTQDALDISPRGYTGAHYAVWPPELVRQLIDEMCPRRVCITCGEPSRRIVGEATYPNFNRPNLGGHSTWESGLADGKGASSNKPGYSRTRVAPTLGWSDCGCSKLPQVDNSATWRPGRILDPFVGSGTTLAVASGMARDSVGIDLDPRSADLTQQRVGMFLEVDYGTTEPAA